MSTSTITVGSNTYTLVSLPGWPGPADMVLEMNDAIASVQSPYVPSQIQTQEWVGADGWAGQITMPPLSNDQAADWEGFLAALRGKLNVFQIGDPRRAHPRGQARGVPVTASGNTALSHTLLTTGWTANIARLLLRGDMLQLGYHLYRVTDTVSSDGSGNATIPVWPCLREAPSLAQQVIFSAPVGLWRLAENKRQAQFSKQRLTAVSFKIVEAR